MKYFRVYKQNARVAKAYEELTVHEFNAEIVLYAELNLPEITDEDGNIDYEALEIENDYLCQYAAEQTKYSGLDNGDYLVYQRRDDFDMYEITRETR